MFEGNLAADPVALRITVHNRKIAKEATLPLRSILPSGVYQEYELLLVFCGGVCFKTMI